MKPLCSIVIRAYNEERRLGRLLDGILQQTIKDVEVTLVDSGSTDNTLAVAGRYPLQVVHIRPEEFSFGRSLNRGIAASGADLLVFASAHVYPIYPDWLERLLEPFDDARVALTYGKQRGDDGTHFSERQIFASWFPDRPRPGLGYPFCNNANAAIRRKLWEQHPYDETLPGLEDLAWARWAVEQGYRIQYVGDAEVVHVHRETPRAVYNRYRREGMAFKQIYPQERFGLDDLARLFLVNIWNDWRAAARQGVLGKHWRAVVWFRWMQFWGTFQGYRQSGPLTWQLKQAFYYPPGAQTEISSPRRKVAPILYHDEGD
jgi:rhamnosyltransferase